MAPGVGASNAEGPWSERHRPKHLGQVIGNTDNVRKLAEWLRDWDDVCLKGKLKEIQDDGKGFGKGKWSSYKHVPDNLNARAALITGPPGIGKTTTCTLVARCNRKYKVMEFNASDARSKSVIDSMSNSLAGNSTLSLGKGGSGSVQRAVIIMDECDGMAGGGDKGGMAALINMIKTTKNPIICICNDRQDMQVRKLAEHCLDIKFRKPETSAVSKRIKNILEGEGKKINLMALEATVEACGQDVRQIINQMQFFGTHAFGGGTEKDTQAMLTPFDAAQRLLYGKDKSSGKALETNKKMDMFFIDADLMPLMVQENYSKTCENGTKPDQTEDEQLSTCAYAAELIASADEMSGNWEVMSSSAVIGTIYPAFLTSTDNPNLRATFPVWLQKKAPQNKAERLAKEMHSKMRAVTTTSARSLVTSSYHDILYKRLLQPLTFGDTKKCAAQLSGCGLNRDFFTEQAPVLRAPLKLDQGYMSVDGTSKIKLLSELNDLQPKTAPVKRKRQAGDGDDDGDEDAVKKIELDEVGGGMFKRKVQSKTQGATGKKPEKSKAATDVANARALREAKMTLGSWVKKEVKVVVEGEEVVEEQIEKNKNVLILKFIEGHTNAVRRKIHLSELLTPWREF